VGLGVGTVDGMELGDGLGIELGLWVGLLTVGSAVGLGDGI